LYHKKNEMQKPLTTINSDKRVTRCEFKGSVFSGVCSGISNYFGINVHFLRIVWVLSILFYGFGIFSYIFMTIYLPSDQNK